MTIVYIRQIFTVAVDIDADSYDCDDADQVELSVEVAANPDAHEHIPRPGVFVDADYEIVTDADEIAELNAETMTWALSTEFLGRREAVTYPKVGDA